MSRSCRTSSSRIQIQVSWKELPHHVAHHGAFETERQVAGIAEQGHLEKVKAVHKWHGVHPFCHAVEVPHFPEKSADQGGERQTKDALPVTGLERRENRLAPLQALKRADDEYW